MEKKFNYLKKIFTPSMTQKEIFNAIISFGKNLDKYPDKMLNKNYLVEGCQSELYLTHDFINKKIKFYIYSDALISKGLAAILIYLYSNESPEKIFTSPPLILTQLDIIKKISINRQIGISNLFKKMQTLSAQYI